MKKVLRVKKVSSIAYFLFTSVQRQTELYGICFKSISDSLHRWKKVNGYKIKTPHFSVAPSTSAQISGNYFSSLKHSNFPHGILVFTQIASRFRPGGRPDPPLHPRYAAWFPGHGCTSAPSVRCNRCKLSPSAPSAPPCQ